MNKPLLFILLLFIYCNSATKGQTPLEFRYCNIFKLTQDEGLSQSSNYFTFEDSEGFMWITANDAMNRYDGKMVKVYKKDFYFKNCPPLKQGYGIVEDSLKNIYVGSTDGLYVYNRGQDRFTMQKIFVDAIDNNTIPFAFKNNKIWCYNRQYNIASYDVLTKKIKYYNAIKMESLLSMHSYLHYVTNYFYRQPFFDSTGVLWIANSSVLAAYNIASNKVNYFLENFTTTNNLKLQGCCYNNKINTVLFATEKGLLKFNLITKKEELIQEVGGVRLGSLSEINFFGENLVCKIAGYGLLMINHDYTEVYNFEKNIYPYSMRNFMNMKPDKSNRLWFCDNGVGLVIFDFNAKTFFSESGQIDSKNYFYGIGINGFAETSNQEIIVRSGVNLFSQNKKTKKIKQILSDKKILYTFLSADLERSGFWYYDQKNIIHYDKNYNKGVNTNTNSEFYGYLQDMVEIKKGKLLLAFSKGVFLFDASENKINAISTLPNNDPFKINLLSNNRIAISYLNGEMLLASFDYNNRIMPTQKILLGKHSFYIDEDLEKNQYWVATDNGLYLLDSKFSTIKKIDANTEIAGTYIYGLLSDDVGNIWCSHERGISSINKNTYKITNFGKEDGIQGWDFNNRSFYKDTDGTLYFGGVNGYNYFKPPIARTSFYKPEIYIDEIKINNKPYLSDTNFNYIRSISTSASNNNISFHTIAKDLGGGAENEIGYRFKGKENFWNLLPNNSNIVFNSLSPGKYLLEIATHNLFTKENISQKLIEINIVPAFYQTNLFYIFSAILLTAIALWLYLKRRFAKQQRRFEQQLSIEEERSRITADLHDDIGSSLSSLQVYSAVANQIIDNDKEKAKAMLLKISTQSTKLLDTIGDIIWSMKSDKEQFISVSSRIKNFVSDVLSAADINYTIHIDSSVDHPANNITGKKNIMLIVKEAVNNCVKYSMAKHVKINVEEHNQILKIEITDNGVGMENIELIKGNGLRNMKKRTEELNGIFEIISTHTIGTSIICKIPLTSIRDSNT